MGLNKTRRNFCEGERQRADDLQGKSGELAIQISTGCFPKKGLAGKRRKRISHVVKGPHFVWSVFSLQPGPSLWPNSSSSPSPRLSVGAPGSGLRPQTCLCSASLPSQSHPSFTPAQTAACWWWRVLTWFKHLGISICLPLISAQKLDFKLLIFFFTLNLLLSQLSLSQWTDTPTFQLLVSSSLVPSLTLFFISQQVSPLYLEAGSFSWAPTWPPLVEAAAISDVD